MKKLIVLILILLSGYCISAQNYSNLRKKTIIVSDSVKLDSLSIIPGSEIVKTFNGTIISDSVYTINASSASITFETENISHSSVEITYRVFPLNFSAQYPKIPLIYNKYDTTHTEPQPILYHYYENEHESEKTNLDVAGNISRGINIGNSQNMTVNSNLNLQLSGEIGSGLYVEALLSDKNVPIQPDGYTQQVGEFDQVYIRIYDSIRSLQMGDVEINSNNSHFLKFNRRILGGDFTNRTIKLGTDTYAQSQISAAISKGNFNRNSFIGIEGVQGPYQLKGRNNENYIMILAGTEKVYLDGMELRRGEDQDYIINYNTAEISFTPKHYITKDSRIMIEFEYSDKNYNRFVLYTKNEIAHKKGKHAIHYFTEGDAKNQPVNQQLSNEHKKILANAGTDPLNAIIQNYDSVEFDPNRVLYKMVDTAVNSVHYDSVLVFSTNRDSAFYEAGFALVGENRGNYVQQISAANGKVFKWVAPINGASQGNYEPIQLLIAPEKQQMLIIKSDYQLSSNTIVSSELAYADKNENSFSTSPEARSNGIAIKNTLTNNKKINSKVLATSLNYEFKQKNFKPIERYREAEFNRDWNLISTIENDEHFIQAQIALLKSKQQMFKYSLEHLNMGDTYVGLRNTIQGDVHFGKNSFSITSGVLNSRSDYNKTQFYRHKITVSRLVWKIKLGLHHDFEDNQHSSISSDSLLNNSQKYSLAEAFITNSDSLAHQFRLSYRNRLDYLPTNNNFKETMETDDIAFSFAPKPNDRHQLKTIVTWRSLKFKQQIPSTHNKDEQNLLSRIDHKYNSNKKTIGIYTFYEIGTGLENRKEFSYVEVQPGQGIYVWNDYNLNGVAELDEFEISPFPEEANYLRIYTPADDYIKVYSLKLNETIKINPRRAWRNENGIRKILSNFENTFTFRASQKHTQNSLISKINPLPNYVEDTAQINRNISFRNTLSFNRSHPKLGFDYSYNQQNYKLLQNSGFDLTDSYMHQIKIRWNIFTELLIMNYSNYKQDKFHSDFFKDKNYHIESMSNLSSLQWQPTTKFRIIIHYKINNKQNNYGSETALMQESGPEIKLNAPKKGMVSIKASIIANKYNGSLNSPLTYNMLEGFQPGENYRWSANYSRNINNFLRVNLNYTGRKPNNSSIVHTGHFSVSAIF